MMNSIEKLISEKCPDGVEYKKIQDIFDMKNGYTPSKSNEKFWTNGTVNWFRMEDIRENGRILSDSIQKIHISAVKGGRLFKANSIALSTSATIGVHALLLTDCLTNQRFTIFHPKKEYDGQIDMYYMNYYFDIIDSWCLLHLNTGNFASVDMDTLKKLEIPVPPIEVQQEIVRILDKFTELEAKLTEELETRKKQYEYYRDELLTFGDDVEKKSLGEVCELSAGGDAPKTHMSIEKTEKYCVPIYSNGIGENALYGYTDIAKITKPSVTISARGTIGWVALRSESYFPIVRLITATPNNDKELNVSFLKYYIDTLSFSTPDAGIPQLTVPDVSIYEVPIPDIVVQERIVEILDRFDTLCNDSTVGLPAEIAARHKQYEYYRDKLLTFERLGA